MSRAASISILAVLSAVSVFALASCGGSSGGPSSGGQVTSEQVIARFKQEGVALHEVSGTYAGGEDTQLAPDSRAKFGDFVVHLVKSANGFSIAEAGAGQAGPDGVRWDDALADHNPPYFTSFKRYGSSLELQWSSEVRSTDKPQWRQLDAILHQLAN